MAGALGAGLLVGTALAVIIPEGFHAFQAAERDSGDHCNANFPYCVFCWTPSSRPAMHAALL